MDALISSSKVLDPVAGLKSAKIIWSKFKNGDKDQDIIFQNICTLKSISFQK